MVLEIINTIDPISNEFAIVCANATAFIFIEPKKKEGQFYAAPLRSPTVQLVQGIFNIYKDHSFFILRNRIFTSAQENETDKGLVKVTAKKITFNVAFENCEALRNALSKTTKFEMINSDWPLTHEPMRETCFLMDPTEAVTKIENFEAGFGILEKFLQIREGQYQYKSRDLHDRHRRVACLLLDSSMQIVMRSYNSSAVNKTYHAEVNLIQRYLAKYNQKLPSGFKLIVTHKPCKMCAGFIFDSADDPTALEVVYLHTESGSHSNSTVLDKYKINYKIQLG